MSEVFRAVNRDKGETVALKRILPTVEEDEEFVTLFEDEARIAQFLDHENIAESSTSARSRRATTLPSSTSMASRCAG